MKKTSKIFSLLLALIMIMSSLFAVGSSAVDVNGFTFADKNGDYKLTGISASLSGEIEIPSKVNDKNVVEIAEGAFDNNMRITGVKIPATVTVVNKYAFRGCINLRKAEFASSSSAVSVRERAFSGCEKLETITMPENISLISKNCFENCYALSGISIPDTVTNIADEAFIHCISLADVVIPASVSLIGSRAFMNCTSLNSFSVKQGSQSFKAVNGVLFSLDGKELVQYPIGRTAQSYTVPAGVETIGKGAFAFGKLTSVTLPAGLKTIDEKGFSDCTQLSSINFPDSLETIGINAFLNCASLKKITLPAKVTEFDNAFVGSGLEEVIIASGITEICDHAFADCKALKKVEIPETVTSIGVNAFGGCTSLEEISIPSSVTSIGNAAFDRCDKLTIIAEPGSYAAQYAAEKGIQTKEPEEEEVSWFIRLIRAIGAFFKSIFEAIASLFN